MVRFWSSACVQTIINVRLYPFAQVPSMGHNGNPRGSGPRRSQVQRCRDRDMEGEIIVVVHGQGNERIVLDNMRCAIRRGSCTSVRVENGRCADVDGH